MALKERLKVPLKVLADCEGAHVRGWRCVKFKIEILFVVWSSVVMDIHCKASFLLFCRYFNNWFICSILLKRSYFFIYLRVQLISLKYTNLPGAMQNDIIIAFYYKLYTMQSFEKVASFSFYVVCFNIYVTIVEWCFHVCIWNYNVT